MSMFDGIEDWLDKNRKPAKKKRKGEATEGIFGSASDLKGAPVEDQENDEMMDEVAKMIQEKFGGKTKVLKGGQILVEQQVVSRDGHQAIWNAIEKLKTNQDAIMQAVTKALEQAGVKPYCHDSLGNKLAKGDVLKVGDGTEKTVLELGYGYALLSHTRDANEPDAVWLEEEIQDRGYIKK